jgi:hypothetical protein
MPRITGIPPCPNTETSSRQIGGNHYLNMTIQPWDAMQSWMSAEEYAGFLRGNVIKYIARYRNKNGLEDLKKARHYLERLIEIEAAKQVERG